MGIVTALAIASLVVAAGSAYMQNKNQQQARKDQKKAAGIAAAQNTVANQNSIRDQVRQQRIRTAQIMQASENTGTTGSSGALGGVSALASQSGANIGTINENANTQTGLLSAQNSANANLSQAATWGAVGSLASSTFNVFSSTPEFKQSAAKAGTYVNNLFA